MAFRDQSVVLYDGQIKLEYKDASHRYYWYELLPDGTWGQKQATKGVTTILSGTLEKSGLMTWPLNMAMKELFGFYESFIGSDGKPVPAGLRGKGKGTMLDSSGKFRIIPKEELLSLVQSANKAWQRRQKQGADIGSLVHDAIEQYVLGTPFALTLEKYEEGQEFENEEARQAWYTTAQEELDQAIVAFERFKLWWEETKPTLINAEQIVYSREFDYSGAYDALLEIDGRRVLVDWKTSNASVSAGAPQGVYYSYFIQSAAYALALMEMGEPEIHDLMIVSARKDGEFDAVMASEVGLYMSEAIDWWKSVVYSYRMMDRIKQRLANNNR